MKYKIKRPALFDIFAVDAIEHNTFPTPWPFTALFYDLFLSRQTVYLVAKSGSKLVGYGGMRIEESGEAHITNIAVIPAFRRQGIASEFLRRLVAGASAAGCARVTLEVRKSNAAAQRLYEKNGFIQSGRMENYYRNPREHAVVMSRLL